MRAAFDRVFVMVKRNTTCEDDNMFVSIRPPDNGAVFIEDEVP